MGTRNLTESRAKSPTITTPRIEGQKSFIITPIGKCGGAQGVQEFNGTHSPMSPQKGMGLSLLGVEGRWHKTSKNLGPEDIKYFMGKHILQLLIKMGLEHKAYQKLGVAPPKKVGAHYLSVTKFEDTKSSRKPLI